MASLQYFERFLLCLLSFMIFTRSTVAVAIGSSVLAALPLSLGDNADIVLPTPTHRRSIDVKGRQLRELSSTGLDVTLVTTGASYSSTGKGDGDVIIDECIWNSPLPSATCVPPCNLVLPPYVLAENITITFPPFRTTVTGSDGAVTTSSVITVTFLPVTTSVIEVYNHHISGTETSSALFMVTPCAFPVPVTITHGLLPRDLADGSSTTIVVESIPGANNPPWPMTITSMPTEVIHIGIGKPGPTCVPGNNCGTVCKKRFCSFDTPTSVSSTSTSELPLTSFSAPPPGVSSSASSSVEVLPPTTHQPPPASSSLAPSTSGSLEAPSTTISTPSLPSESTPSASSESVQGPSTSPMATSSSSDSTSSVVVSLTDSTSPITATQSSFLTSSSSTPGAPVIILPPVIIVPPPPPPLPGPPQTGNPPPPPETGDSPLDCEMGDPWVPAEGL